MPILADSQAPWGVAALEGAVSLEDEAELESSCPRKTGRFRLMPSARCQNAPVRRSSK